MKKLILTLFIGLSAVTAFGQNQDEEVNQRFFEAKIREFVYRLQFTDEQRDAFIPIYKRYSDEMRAAMGEWKKPEGRPETSEEAAARAKARIERQQMAQSIRLKYIDEFAAVLAPEQVSRLYEVEGQINRKLMERKREGAGRHGQHGGQHRGEGRRQHRDNPRAPRAPRR